MNLEATTTVVTGGAGGIGLAVGIRIRAAGGKVAVLDIDEAAAYAAAEQLSQSEGHAAGFGADVTDPDSLARAFKDAVKVLGPIDGLVTCAGIRQSSAPIESFPHDEWRSVLDVDLFGTFTTCQIAAGMMVERGSGSIVTIGSTSATLSRIGQAAYCSAKAGVAALTKVLALELAERGVRANCVNPASTQTGLTAAWSAPGESSVEDRVYGNPARFLAGNPMRRLARPEEVANAIVFLLSPEASYITGHALAVDGGESIV